MNGKFRILVKMNTLLSEYAGGLHAAPKGLEPTLRDLEKVRQLQEIVFRRLISEAENPRPEPARERLEAEAEPLIFDLEMLVRRPGLQPVDAVKKTLRDFYRLYTILGPNEFPDDQLVLGPNQFPDDD